MFQSVSFALLAALLLVFSLPACPCSSGDEKEGGQRSLSVEQEPEPEATPDEAQDEQPLDPTSFAGFSEDESRFAYSAYSTGARVHIFTVVETATGKRLLDLPLHDESMVEIARTVLDEGSFVPIDPDGRGALEEGQELRLESEPGKVRVSLITGGSLVELRAPEPMAAAARRLRRPDVHLGGFSPSGAFLAVKVTDDQGELLGKATTFQVLPLERAPEMESAQAE
ncbi:MAG: hypothetical protein ACOC0J_02310 [Myxococcota bacterium]